LTIEHISAFLEFIVSGLLTTTASQQFQCSFYRKIFFVQKTNIKKHVNPIMAAQAFISQLWPMPVPKGECCKSVGKDLAEK